MKMHYLRLVVGAALLALGARGFAEEVALDFRGSKLHEGAYNYDGPNAKDFITPDEQGLRWRYSGGKAPKKPVGISWRTHISGDFTATAHYEIVQVDRPERGNGVGIEMYLTLDTPEPRDGISYARLMHPIQGPLIWFNHMTNDEKGKRYSKGPVRLETTIKTGKGRLRLARDGKMLMALAAEGDQDFKEIHRREIDAEILKVRFACLDGGTANAELDIRLVEFNLTEKAPGQAGAAPAPAARPTTETAPEPEPSRSMLWIALLLGGVLLVAFLGVVAVTARKRKTPAPPPVQPHASALIVACPACGKKLKVKEEMAGRRVKCSGCGQALSVPAKEGD